MEPNNIGGKNSNQQQNIRSNILLGAILFPSSPLFGLDVKPL